MNRRMIVTLSLAALVAAGIAIVYAWQPQTRLAQAQTTEKAPEAPTNSGAKSGSETAKTSPATPSDGGGPQVIYDPSTLPEPVRQTLGEIYETAQGGNIEAMRPVLESNELKPMVASTHVDDPVAFWKKNSADGEGRAVLAALLNILSTGFVKSGNGNDAIYVWPYFAEMDLTKLSPAQEVELYRVVPAQQALEMKKSGKYTYYRLGVSPTGVWQYFLQ
jgi:hypothetical protein